jgi:N-methylhydantoinase A/oxoprolinase/acetone carboxylase beta subunit
VSAEGVVSVVDAAMVQAVRRVTVERGVDPRGLALVAFGGAGPLHACAIAAELGMPAVVVPPRAGVLSAVGLLSAPLQHDLVRSWPDPNDHSGLDAALARLAEDAGAGDEVVTAVDCRYAGQSHEITVATVAEFEDEHRRRNGYAQPGVDVEVVAIRASVRTHSPIAVDSLPATGGRLPAIGPAVLAEPDCTVWVPEGWTAELGGGDAWILRPSRS